MRETAINPDDHHDNDKFHRANKERLTIIERCQQDGMVTAVYRMKVNTGRHSGQLNLHCAALLLVPVFQ